MDHIHARSPVAPLLAARIARVICNPLAATRRQCRAQRVGHGRKRHVRTQRVSFLPCTQQSPSFCAPGCGGEWRTSLLPAGTHCDRGVRGAPGAQRVLRRPLWRRPKRPSGDRRPPASQLRAGDVVRRRGRLSGHRWCAHPVRGRCAVTLRRAPVGLRARDSGLLAERGLDGVRAAEEPSSGRPLENGANCNCAAAAMSATATSWQAGDGA
jgi:hypothetical protein